MGWLWLIVILVLLFGVGAIIKARGLWKPTLPGQGSMVPNFVKNNAAIFGVGQGATLFIIVLFGILFPQFIFPHLLWLGPLWLIGTFLIFAVATVSKSKITQTAFVAVMMVLMVAISVTSLPWAKISNQTAAATNNTDHPATPRQPTYQEQLAAKAKAADEEERRKCPGTPPTPGHPNKKIGDTWEVRNANHCGYAFAVVRGTLCVRTDGDDATKLCVTAGDKKSGPAQSFPYTEVMSLGPEPAEFYEIHCPLGKAPSDGGWRCRT